MTGLAIVLYLNQTPMQPRERDYAYAGSFYAYAIWIGLGVARHRRPSEAKMKLSGTAVTAIVAVGHPARTYPDGDHRRGMTTTVQDVTLAATSARTI